MEMTTTAPTTFDMDAAIRRRFMAGMDPHGDPAGIVDERRAFIARHPRPEGFCPRCTHHKPAAATICRPCTIEGA